MAASLRLQFASASSSSTCSSSGSKLMPGSSQAVCHSRNEKSPGTKCPTCAARGKEVWVIPGRLCGYCGTACE